MIITFDLGTTRLKVAAFAIDGSLLGQTAIRNREYQDNHRRWQDADLWWQNCCTAFANLCDQYQLDRRAITGFSVSGRAGATVFVDAAGNVVAHPWSDTRHNGDLKEVLASGAPLYAATLAAKFRWLSREQPAMADRTTRLLYAKDFLLFRLTGQSITDPSSGPDSMTWPDAICDSVGAERLPATALPWSIAGSLTSDAARALGCPSGAPVATGAHDGIAANIGAGAIADHQFALTLGTHAVLRAPSSNIVPDVTRFYGFPPDRHVYGGNALWSGRAIDWFLDHWFDHTSDDRTVLYNKLDEQLSLTPATQQPAFFLPYPGGQIAPTRQSQRRAEFRELGLQHDRLSMYRAVIHGTAFAIKQNYAWLAAAMSPEPTIALTGSGVLARYWCQAIASLLDHSLTVTDASSEGRGAAICLAVALGYHETLEAAAAAMIQPTRVIEPDPEQRAILSREYGQWLTFSPHSVS